MLPHLCHDLFYSVRCPNMAVENADAPADNEEEEDEMDKKAQNVSSDASKKRKIKYVCLKRRLITWYNIVYYYAITDVLLF